MTVHSLKGTALSNMACGATGFAPLTLQMKGVSYPSVEHAFQAAKTLDDSQRARIATCRSPYEAKKLGRQVKMRADWEEIKVEVMRAALKIKFRVPEYAQALQATSGEIREENTWHDNFWGSCTCPRCGNRGKNMLGQLLMEMRG